MAQTGDQHPTHLGAIILLSLVALLLPQNAAAEKGFSLELIHRDSIYSPLYPGNLTDVERLRRLTGFAKSYANWRFHPNEVGIRPPVSNKEHIYMVRVDIGTPPTPLHLLLDTGSDVIWTQCLPCNPCFEQVPPIYRPSGSSTFHKLPYNHPLCIPPSHNSDGACSFELRYFDDTYARGVLATEHFTFPTRSGGTETIPGVVFGCSHQTSENMFADHHVGGILAMEGGPQSFIMQLGNRARRRFSYCLVPITLEGLSHLRFGRDIVIAQNAQVTPFLPSSRGSYDLDLLDISVNDRHLNLPRRTFAYHPDGSGGCSIDSGAALTHLIRPAYDAVKIKLRRHFEEHNLYRIDGSDLGMDLCYHRPPNPVPFPTMVLHFRGADLRLETLNLFFMIDDPPAFCFTMVTSDHGTIIGVSQQQNIRFVYDLRRNQLSFAHENCAGN